MGSQLVRSLWLVACATAVWGCERPAAQKPAERGAELPISKVVLYQNGVGYFEKRGKVDKKLVELRVRPDQINDVLKSLSILDLSGGAASAVSLPVEKSGDRLAAELPPQVRNATGLVGLLAVLRGADVQVSGKAGNLRGRVVGVELPPRQGGDKDGGPPRGAILTLMTGDDRLATTPVDGIGELVIGDRTLSVGLKQSLDISRADGAWKPASLHIRLAGDKTHDLIVSYIHEVPVWRPAYRAWVEKDKGVLLQGWAIVDNTSGEDWADVKLTLVAGSPLSFRYNLHTPHMVERPDLSPRLPQSADAPPEPDVGVQPADAPPPPPAAAAPAAEAESAKAEAFDLGDYSGGGAKLVAGSGGGGAGERAAPLRSRRGEFSKDMAPAEKPAAAPRPKVQSRGPTGSDPGEETKRREAAARSATALMSGREVGALYAYEAQHSVTVPDRSAALINLLNKKLDGRDVLLFRDMGQPPYHAILIKNDGGATVEGGPITLYVDGTFAGEGFIGRVAKNETAFVPYARETGYSLALTAKDEEAELHLAKIVDGRIRIEGKRLHKRTLSIEATRDKPALCYVKVAATAGMTLREPPKEMVKAGQDLYVPVHAPASGKGETVLVEESPVWFEETALNDRSVAALQLYLKNATAEAAIKGPIGQLLALWEEMATLERDSGGLRKQRDLLQDEQYRIQGNLDALPHSAVAAELRRQLVAQLTAASDKAAVVAKKLVENEVKLAAHKEKMITLLRSVTLK
ncbi:MAG: hypothetical protein FJ100_15280 [Deltaproteobacteria bacterium]|nr:hypothetical protein [Deltaproteobacteria bacterium]